MKNLKILGGLLLVGLALNSCSLFSTSEPELPPETQEGKGTFGCKVNGKIWIPKEEGLLPQDNPLAAMYTNNRNLSIIAMQPKQSIIISMKDIIRTTDKVTYCDTAIFRVNAGFFNNKEYGKKNQTAIGCIEFTSMIPGFCIAGRFNLKIPSEIPGDTLYLTEGRFDLR